MLTPSEYSNPLTAQYAFIKLSMCVGKFEERLSCESSVKSDISGMVALLLEWRNRGNRFEMQIIGLLRKFNVLLSP